MRRTPGVRLSTSALPIDAMPRLRLFAVLLLALTVCACASVPKPPKSQIAFIDSRIFDEELTDALTAGLPEVTVETDASVTLGHIPERMDKWLYAVREADNPVVARPTQEPLVRSIGLVALLQAIATGTYEFLRESMTYYPARNYQATVLYDKPTGRVERVVFTAVASKTATPTPKP